jgi:hypothetical protein
MNGGRRTRSCLAFDLRTRDRWLSLLARSFDRYLRSPLFLLGLRYGLHTVTRSQRLQSQSFRLALARLGYGHPTVPPCARPSAAEPRRADEQTAPLAYAPVHLHRFVRPTRH